MELDQKDFIEKQLKANEEKTEGSSMADLVDPNSSANKSPEVLRLRDEIKPKPTIDKEGYPIIQTLRTYHGDVADAVKGDNLTITKMAMASQKRSDNQEDLVQDQKNSIVHLIIVIISIILFIAGVGAVIYTFFIKKDVIQTPVTQKKELTILASEEKVSFDITNANKPQIQSDVESELSKIPKDQTIREMIPTVKTADGSSGKATIDQFLSAMNARIPDKLTRSLYANYFLGINFIGKGEPFMIFFTSSYDIAYPALLDWEGYLKDDFAPYFYPINSRTDGFVFKDAVVYNHDARALQDNKGNILFFYTVIDTNTIIFARTSDTLKEILERMRIAKLQ